RLFAHVHLVPLAVPMLVPAQPQPALKRRHTAAALFNLLLGAQQLFPLSLQHLQRFAPLLLILLLLEAQSDAFAAKLILQAGDFLLALFEMGRELKLLLAEGDLPL